MKRTLWSLLVGAAAVFPAFGGAAPATETALPAASTVAPDAHRVEEQKQVRVEKKKLDETRDDPAPSCFAGVARASITAAPRLVLAVPQPSRAVVPTARALRLPPPRAP